MKKYAYFLLLAGLATTAACKKDKKEEPAPAQPTVYLSAVVNGAQQTPPNASTATGTFSGEFNPNTRVLTYRLVYQGLTPSAAHIHLGAPGVSGTVIVPFTVTAATVSPITGTVTFSETDAATFKAQALYVNMHTAAFPNGEIRGDITKSETAPLSVQYLSAVVNGAQQTSPTASPATGSFTGSYNPNTRVLTYRLTYQGLTPSAAHIHVGAPGVAGAVIVSVTVTPSPIIGTATLTAADAATFTAQALYVNLHTAAFPNGEIRGDITKN